MARPTRRRDQTLATKPIPGASVSVSGKFARWYRGIVRAGSVASTVQSSTRHPSRSSSRVYSRQRAATPPAPLMSVTDGTRRRSTPRSRIVRAGGRSDRGASGAGTERARGAGGTSGTCARDRRRASSRNPRRDVRSRGNGHAPRAPGSSAANAVAGANEGRTPSYRRIRGAGWPMPGRRGGLGGVWQPVTKLRNSNREETGGHEPTKNQTRANDVASAKTKGGRTRRGRSVSPSLARPALAARATDAHPERSVARHDDHPVPRGPVGRRGPAGVPRASPSRARAPRPASSPARARAKKKPPWLPARAIRGAILRR